MINEAYHAQGSKEELLKCNLVILYDHEEQHDVFILKDPAKEEILRISKIIPCKGFYKDTDPEREKEAIEYDYGLETHYCFVNLENIIEVDYDDEDMSVSEYFQSLKNLFIECYKILTCDATDPGFHLHYDVVKPNDTPEYELRSLALEKVLDNDESPIQYFYTIDEWEKKNSDDVEKKLKEMKATLVDFKTFVQHIRDLYVNSVCDCDSGWSSSFVDLKNEKVLLGSKKTKFHFIKSYDEYKQMLPGLKKQRDEESKREHEEWIKKHPQNESIKTWNVL